MSNLQDLLAERAKIDLQIAEARRADRKQAVVAARKLVLDYDILAAELFRPGTGRRAKGSIEAKYRNPATGESWAGRGRQPRWLAAAIAAGRRIEEFAV